MSTPTWIKRPIFAATTQFEHDAVLYVQRSRGWPETGEMDDTFRSQLRGIQSLFGLPVTGILDLETAEQIDRLRHWGSVEGTESWTAST